MAKSKTTSRTRKQAEAALAEALAPAVIKKQAVKKQAPQKTIPKRQSASAAPALPKHSAKNQSDEPQPVDKNTADKQPAVRAKLASVWRISRAACLVVWHNKKLFIGILVVYLLCNLLLVQTTTALRQNLARLDTTSGISLSGGLTRFSILLVSAGSGATQAGAAYLSLLIVIVSLALIWALRESFAGRLIRIRDSFYKGMYPLVPAILVLLMIFIHLLPIAIGAGIFGVIVQHGIATNGIQVALAGLLPIAGLSASIYFLSHSIFAAYIVTLPDMTPLKALRSAKELVRHRRWTIIRKLLFLPLAFLIIAIILMLPFVLFLQALAPQAFFVLTGFGLVGFHAYMYSLYRELLA